MSKRRIWPLVALGVIAATLVAVSPVGSRPGAGITISAREPITAMIGAPDSSGIYQYAVVVSARFSPEVLHDDARVSFTHLQAPGGAAYPPFTLRDSGNVVHTTAVYQHFFAAVEESRLLVTAKWNAWTPKPSGTVSGTKTSPAHILNVPKREPAPRLSPQAKQNLAQDAQRLYQKCASWARGRP